MRCFAQFGTICAIYKNVKTLNCANGTKSRKVSDMKLCSRAISSKENLNSVRRKMQLENCFTKLNKVYWL